MGTELRLRYERTVDVRAPIARLYDEVGSVTALGRFLPMLHELAPTGAQDAACHTDLRIGPLHYRVGASLALRSINPPRQIELLIDMPAVRSRLVASFHLHPSSRQDTTLRYEAVVSTAHPVLRHLSRSWAAVLEEHVVVTTRLLSSRVAQYARAAHLFGTHPIRRAVR